MKRKLIPLFLAPFGIILSIWLYHISQFSPPEKTYRVPPPINPFPSSIVAAGIVESVNENINIGTPVAGLVTNVYVNVGMNVQKGQPLFSLDTRDLKAKLAVQKMNIGVAEANLNKTEDSFLRLQGVEDERAVSVDEKKSKEFELEIMKQQLKVAKAQVEETEALINRLTVRAPQDGIILQKNIHEGEYASQTDNKATIILGDVDTLQVRTDVDEYNTPKFSVTSPAVAYPKSNTTVAIPLHFTRIEPYMIPKKSLTGGADERVDTRVLQIIYNFDQPKDYTLYVGQQLDVYIKSDKE